MYKSLNLSGNERGRLYLKQLILIMGRAGLKIGMHPSVEADKFSNPKSCLNVKELGYFKAFAGVRVAHPSFTALSESAHRTTLLPQGPS
jgi:hypothetical protein